MVTRVLNQKSFPEMRFISSPIAVLGLFVASVVASRPKFPILDPCTLTASGGDDAPQFLKAAKDCLTVTIPKKTTLNIETRLNMTGLRDKHIVSFGERALNLVAKVCSIC